jgi:hypothetical protein
MAKKSFKIFFLFLWFALMSESSSGANRYWRATAAANWNSTANWSTTSGGVGGASVPVSTDLVFFDGNGLGNCTLNAAASVLGMQINAAYSGAISHGGFSLAIGNSGFSIAGGTFTSTGSTITMNGNFTQTGGVFTHSAGMVTFNRNATVQINVLNIINFFNLQFVGTGTSSVYNMNSDTLVVNGTLTFSGISRFAIQNSIIQAKGNISNTNTYVGQNTHTGGLILICGTGNQTLSSSSATLVRAYLPTVQINKTSGTLFFSNKICVEGNWKYEAGTLDYSTNPNTICFIYGKNFTGVSHSLGNVEFNTPGATNSAFNLGSIALTTTGALTLSGGTGQLTLQSSTINAQGNIIITHSRTTSNSSTTSIIANGSVDQTIYGTSATNMGRLPKFTINKSSGTLFLKDYVTIEGNYLYTAGTIDYTTFYNVVCFNAPNTTITLAGSHTLGSVEFYGGVGNIYSLSGGGMTLNVDGVLWFTGTSQFRLSGGTINAKGDINVTNSYNANNSHTTSLVINGTVNQTFNSSVASGNGRLPNITINKASGTLSISGTISTEGNLTYTGGTVDSQTSTFAFFNSAKTIDAEGASSTMEFYNATLGDASTRTLTGDLIVQNVLALQTGRIWLNNNVLTLQNGLASALTVSTGGLYGDDSGNNGKVSWMIGTNTGAHVIPFENVVTFDIPFTFNLTAGDAGTVSISTFPTNNANLPFPITPQLVTNVFTSGTIDNSPNTVNRFWQIDKTGANPVADLTFTYADNDWDLTEPTNYQAQRYDEVTDIWQAALPSQTSNSLQNQVIVPNVTTFSPWTLAMASSPLDIEMSTYDIQLKDEKVDLIWGVSNETNILGYRLEKSSDLSDINPFHMELAGNFGYSFADDNPANGVSYYRVVVIENNGEEENLDWKKVEFYGDSPTVSIYPNPVNTGGKVKLVVPAETIVPVAITVFDLMGKLVYTQTILEKGQESIIEINCDFTLGCYILMVNDKKLRLIVN